MVFFTSRLHDLYQHTELGAQKGFFLLEHVFEFDKFIITILIMVT